MSGSTPPFFIERFQLPSGAAMSGGKLYFFVAGSTTVPKNVFADYALTIPLTQPLVLDAAGNVPQYFMEAGLYKILLKDSANVLQYTRDQIEGATSGGGTSALIQDSASIHWTTVTDGGLTYNVGTVQTAAILDHKVLADATAGDVPGYLVAKFVDAAGNPLTVNGTHQLILPFARLDGAEFTGSVIVDGQLSSDGDTALATGVGATVHIVGPATIEEAIANILKLPGITPGQWLMLNGSGQVVGVAAPTSDHKVLYDVSDAIPGFLGAKVQAGSGIQISMTTDGTNGKVMHLNVNPNYSPPNQNVTRAKAISIPISPFTTTPESILNTSGVVITGPGLFIPSIVNGLIAGDQFIFDIFLDALANANCIAEFYLNGVLVPSSSLHLGAGVSRISYLVNYLGAGPGFVDLIGNAVSTNNSVSTQASIGILTPAMDPTIDNVVDVMIRTSTGTTACGSCVWNFRKL